MRTLVDRGLVISTHEIMPCGLSGYLSEVSNSSAAFKFGSVAAGRCIDGAKVPVGKIRLDSLRPRLGACRAWILDSPLLMREATMPRQAIFLSALRTQLP